MKRQLFVALLMLSYACSADSRDSYTPPQAVTVSGSVRDGLSGTALPAKIILGENRLTADAEGGFSQKGVPIGSRLLRVEADGYQSMDRTIEVGIGGLNLELLLFPSGSTNAVLSAAPVLISVAPASALPGATVAISGTRFGEAQLGSLISFGGISATVISWSVDRLEITVPQALSPGAVILTVSVGAQVSNPLPFTVQAVSPAAPEAPGAFTAQADSSFQISLRWTDTSSQETGFIIERKVNTGPFIAYAQIGPNTTQFFDLGVEELVPYAYRIRSFNETGSSAPSNTVSLTTPIAASGGGGGGTAAPTAPTNLQALALGPTSVELTWVPSTPFTETHYWLQRSTAGGAFVWVATIAAGSSVYQDTSVLPGTLYQYRIRAYNMVANTPYISSTPVTTPDVAPAAPGNLSAVALAPMEVVLTWSDYASSETGFVIERKIDGEIFAPVAFVPADTVLLSDTAVSPGRQYVYRIQARNAAGASPYSPSAGVVTPDILPAAPGGLTVTPVGSALHLTWVDNAGNEAGFRVYRSDGATWERIATLPANAATYSDVLLRSGGAYLYSVAAYNTAGESSGASVPATAPLRVPDVPAGLTVIALSSSQAVVTWSNGVTVGTEVRILRAIGAGSFSVVATLAPDAVLYVAGSLTAGTTYRWQVVQANAAGAAGSEIKSLSMPASDGGSLANASLQGRVVLHGGSNHTGITVRIGASGIQSQTQADGTYLITGIPQGEFDIYYELEGYATIRLPSYRFFSGYNDTLPTLTLVPGRVVFAVPEPIRSVEFSLNSVTGPAVVRTESGDLYGVDPTTSSAALIGTGLLSNYWTGQWSEDGRWYVFAENCENYNPPHCTSLKSFDSAAWVTHELATYVDQWQIIGDRVLSYVSLYGVTEAMHSIALDGTGKVQIDPPGQNWQAIPGTSLVLYRSTYSNALRTADLISGSVTTIAAAYFRYWPSPDGSYVLYLTGNPFNLYGWSVTGQSNPVLIASNTGDISPRFAEDGSAFYVDAANSMYVVRNANGPGELIATGVMNWDSWLSFGGGALVYETSSGALYSYRISDSNNVLVSSSPQDWTYAYWWMPETETALYFRTGGALSRYYPLSDTTQALAGTVQQWALQGPELLAYTTPSEDLYLLSTTDMANVNIAAGVTEPARLTFHMNGDQWDRAAYVTTQGELHETIRDQGTRLVASSATDWHYTDNYLVFGTYAWPNPGALYSLAFTESSVVNLAGGVYAMGGLAGDTVTFYISNAGNWELWDVWAGGGPITPNTSMGQNNNIQNIRVDTMYYKFFESRLILP